MAVASPFGKMPGKQLRLHENSVLLATLPFTTLYEKFKFLVFAPLCRATDGHERRLAARGHLAQNPAPLTQIRALHLCDLS